MKRIIIMGMLILFGISFCGAQSIREAAEAQKQREAQQQQAAEAQKQREAQQRQAAEAQKRQEEAAKQQAREAQIKEQAKLREMQLTIDQIFQLVNSEALDAVGSILNARQWESIHRESGKYQGWPVSNISDWRPKISLENLPHIRVHHFGSFDNLVDYVVKDEEHLRRLENEIKAKGYQEIPSESAMSTGANRAEKSYRNSQYEIGFRYNDCSVYALNFKDIDFYREEVARLEREAYERANQPATLHIYRRRRALDILPKRYDILLDNAVAGNSTNNWKTTVTVTSLGAKTVSADIDGRQANVQINFEPGGVYYVRSDVDSKSVETGETKTTTDKNGRTTTSKVTVIQHTPILQLVDKTIGESEFNAIVVR